MTTESSRNVRNCRKTTSTTYTKYVQGFFSCGDNVVLPTYCYINILHATILPTTAISQSESEDIYQKYIHYPV